MENRSLHDLKQEVQLQAKNGVDFIISASILWLTLSFVWTLDYTAYNKSVLSLMVGGIMLPLAFGLSKILKTNWKIKDNPIQPLGLWLNFAQLLYFPLLVFVLIKYPDYFIMAYAIITGAHLFPYAWFYDDIGYLIASMIISVGALLLALNTSTDAIWTVPLLTCCTLLLLSIWIFIGIKKRLKR